MAFNALVNLGTVGEDITGNTVSISGCTGASCGSGCTSLVTGQAVSGFPKTITGIPDNVVSLFVKVDNGQCSGTTQCITINFVAGATATPTATPGPTSTATPTPTPTSTVGPTATPTATPTNTPTATPTPTPTPTVVTYGCGDTVSDTYTPSNNTIQTKYLDLSEATDGDIVTISFAANDRPNRFNIYGNGLLIENSGWVGADNTYAGPWGMPGSLVGSGSGSFTFEYQAGMSYELRVDVGPANPDASPTPNPSDSWSVTIGCASLSPIGFTITSSCVGYAPTGGTITISGATGGTGSGYTVQMIGGPVGYDNTTHNVPYTYTGLTNEVGNTYNFSVCDGSSNCASQALTTAISCSSAPNNTVSANLVIQSTQPTSAQCSSGTPYTFDLGSPTATFCTATTFTASGLTGLGTGNNYWLCSDGQTVQVFHPSNAGYFSKAGSCQTVV